MNGMLYVYKSMLNKLQNEWRSSIIFILLLAMMTALFLSRALLSAAIISFIVFSFVHHDIKGQLRVFISTPLLWGMSLLFLLPLLSGLWSEDKEQWQDMIRVKLPLLALPLAFAAPFGLSKKQWEATALFLIALVTAATAWSMFQYAGNLAAVNESYLRAKIMVTPLENDHVRFSCLVTVALLLAVWLNRNRKRDILFWILTVISAWLIVFLHILAARTGLLAFYIVLTGLAGWFIFQKKKWATAPAILSFLILLPLAAWLSLPSFRNRVRYIRYDFSFFRHADYLPGSSDAVRVISLKAGWQIMNASPGTGVGFGDIDEKANEWYAMHYPSMLEKDKILPSSEWLMFGAGTGWPGFILFTGVMLIPFLMRIKNKLAWCLLNIVVAFNFLFDIGLEVQFGVFIYSFIILWFWKWLVTENI